jgi:hypothetical protein
MEERVQRVLGSHSHGFIGNHRVQLMGHGSHGFDGFQRTDSPEIGYGFRQKSLCLAENRVLQLTDPPDPFFSTSLSISRSPLSVSLSISVLYLSISLSFPRSLTLSSLPVSLEKKKKEKETKKEEDEEKRKKKKIIKEENNLLCKL